MNPFTVNAPAKLNLSLSVLARREDGFHEIDTLMVKLPGLSDRLDFRVAEEFSFTCDDATLSAGEDNLVVKAVRAYENAVGHPCRWAISLEKHIPHGAGLGGGSSDAAATLLGLNQLHDFKLGVAALHELAAALGSDVPFFLKSGAARCTGRGENIVPVPPPPSLRILLLKPAFEVATPDAYRRWRNSREIPGISYETQVVADLPLANDLERPVFEKHRFRAELKQWLLGREETSAALMSGSGSAVFAVLREGANAESLARSAGFELDPGLWSWSGITG